MLKNKEVQNGIVCYPSSFLRKYKKALQKLHGNIYFAGDYSHTPALDGVPWLGGCATNAIIKK